MTRDLPDPRRHAYRADLAAESLRGRVEAGRFVAGTPRQVVSPVLPVRREPRFDAALDTEALMGEIVTVYEEHEGWAWGQLARDSYVGYMPSEGLTHEVAEPTHRIAALRTYIFPQPDSKVPPVALLSLNALVSVSGGDERFLALSGGGFIYARHALPVAERVADFVAVAKSFAGAPYLWGGRTSVGLDCSALVQLSAEAVGLAVPRDADMQAAEIGSPVPWRQGTKLRRGDLVFWEGHVGIMTGPRHLLHANAFHMAVVLEPFAKAKERIKAAGYDVACVRRLPRIRRQRPAGGS